MSPQDVPLNLYSGGCWPSQLRRIVMGAGIGRPFGDKWASSKPSVSRPLGWGLRLRRLRKGGILKHCELVCRKGKKGPAKSESRLEREPWKEKRGEHQLETAISHDLICAPKVSPITTLSLRHGCSALLCLSSRLQLVGFLRQTTLLLSSSPGNDCDQPICVKLAVPVLVVYG